MSLMKNNQYSEKEGTIRDSEQCIAEEFGYLLIKLDQASGCAEERETKQQMLDLLLTLPRSGPIREIFDNRSELYAILLQQLSPDLAVTKSVIHAALNLEEHNASEMDNSWHLIQFIRTSIERQLNKQFGKLSFTQTIKLNTITENELLKLAGKIYSASSLEEVFGEIPLNN